MIDFLKQIFGDEALTFDQLSERIKADASLNIVNIADGSYVPKTDYDAVNDQLTEANAKAAQYTPSLQSNFLPSHILTALRTK